MLAHVIPHQERGAVGVVSAICAASNGLADFNLSFRACKGSKRPDEGVNCSTALQSNPLNPKA